jgi:hypothetical protein
MHRAACQVWIPLHPPPRCAERLVADDGVKSVGECDTPGGEERAVSSGSAVLLRPVVTTVTMV